MYKITKFFAEELQVDRSKKMPYVYYLTIPINSERIKIEINTLKIIEYTDKSLQFLLKENLIEKVETQKIKVWERLNEINGKDYSLADNIRLALLNKMTVADFFDSYFEYNLLMKKSVEKFFDKHNYSMVFCTEELLQKFLEMDYVEMEGKK